MMLNFGGYIRNNKQRQKLWPFCLGAIQHRKFIIPDITGIITTAHILFTFGLEVLFDIEKEAIAMGINNQH